jgi:hypothetical protein
MQSGTVFVGAPELKYPCREMKRSLTNKSLNLTTTVIFHLDNMSLEVSFESYACFEKTDITPVYNACCIRINWDI